MHWLTHVGVVFQCSMNSRVEPFPTTEALVQSNAWPAVRQCRARREITSCRLTVLGCSFIRVVNWPPVWSTERSQQGMLYTTIHRLRVSPGPSRASVFFGEIPSAYAGQTGSQFATRMKEHQSVVRRQSENPKLAPHCLTTGHTFDWTRASVVGNGSGVHWA